MSELAQETLVIFLGLLVAFGLFIFASAKGWVKHLEFGKSGMKVQGVEKQKRSGALNKLLYDQFVQLDDEAFAFAVKTVSNLHDNLLKYLSDKIPHPSGRRVVSAAIRFVLCNIYRQSDLKLVLRPDNLRKFIDSCMLDFKIEYDSATRDQQYYKCPIRNDSCFEYPDFDDILPRIRERVIRDSALPLRGFQIRVHEKKIELNKQFIPSFAELEDFVRVDIAKEDIERNSLFIDALSRKPNEDEI